MPSRRPSYVEKFKVEGRVSIFIGFSFKADGTVGELFIDYAKAGSAMRGLMRAFGLVCSCALQSGMDAAELAQSLDGCEPGSIEEAIMSVMSTGGHPE